MFKCKHKNLKYAKYNFGFRFFILRFDPSVYFVYCTNKTKQTNANSPKAYTIIINSNKLII